MADPFYGNPDTYGPRPDPNRAQDLSDKVNAALAKSNVRRAARPPMERDLLGTQMGEAIPPGYWVNDANQLIDKNGEVVKQEPRPAFLPLTKDLDFTNSTLTDLIQYVLRVPGGVAAKGAGAAAKGAGAGNPASSPFLRNAIRPEEMLNPTIPPTRVPSTVRPLAPVRDPFEDIGKIGLERIAARKPPTPNVNTSLFDDLGRFEGEGGATADAIMAARRMSQEKSAAEEAFRARQLSAADNEGMFARPSPNVNRRAAEEAADQTRIDAMINEGGGAGERYFPGTDFTMRGGSSSGVYRPDFTLPGGSRFGLPAVRSGTGPATIGGPARIGTELVPIGGPARSGTELVPIGGPAFASGAPASAGAGGPDMAAFLRKLGIGGMGGGAVLAALELANQGNTDGGLPNTTTTVPNAVVPNATGKSVESDPETGLHGGPYTGPSIAAPLPSGLRSRLQLPPTTAAAASGPATTAAAAAAKTERSLMERLFGGPEYQSNSRLVVDRPRGTENDKPPMTELNWGDNDRAADFVRADRAMQALQKGGEEFIGKNNTDYEGRASGGGVNRSSSKASGGRDAAIYKALEIIHHMMVNR